MKPLKLRSVGVPLAAEISTRLKEKRYEQQIRFRQGRVDALRRGARAGARRAVTRFAAIIERRTE